MLIYRDWWNTSCCNGRTDIYIYIELPRLWFLRLYCFSFCCFFLSFMLSKRDLRELWFQYLPTQTPSSYVLYPNSMYCTVQRCKRSNVTDRFAGNAHTPRVLLFRCYLFRRAPSLCMVPSLVKHLYLDPDEPTNIIHQHPTC